MKATKVNTVVKNFVRFEALNESHKFYVTFVKVVSSRFKQALETTVCFQNLVLSLKANIFLSFISDIYRIKERQNVGLTTIVSTESFVCAFSSKTDWPKLVTPEQHNFK